MNIKKILKISIASVGVGVTLSALFIQDEVAGLMMITGILLSNAAHFIIDSSGDNIKSILPTNVQPSMLSEQPYSHNQFNDMPTQQDRAIERMREMQKRAERNKRVEQQMVNIHKQSQSIREPIEQKEYSDDFHDLPEEQPGISCPECGKLFKNKNAAQMHYSKSHVRF